jgi:pimeloyl-ACP methyl ester carboxylesterase/DNA-binding CsgD family transcriptional regulator
MQAPPVRYTTTSDGYDIAYTVSGAGPAFVCALGIFSHVQLTWERSESTGPWLEAFSQNFRLVHYDGRGQGLSTRGLEGLDSMAMLCRDLEAVVKALGLRRFILYGGAAFAHVAVHYAVRHPDEVAALILVLATRSGAAWPRSLALGLPEENWELYLRTRVPQNLNRAGVERHVASFKQSITQQDFAAFNSVFVNSDISPLLPRLQMPTLVMHARDQAWISEEEAVKLAAAIPNSRLVAYEAGESAADEAASAVQAMLAFLTGLDDPALNRKAVAGETDGTPGGLSGREIEVLRLVAQGKSNAEISEALVISTNTVVRHLSNIFAKIDVHNRTEAASYAHRRGLT